MWEKHSSWLASVGVGPCSMLYLDAPGVAYTDLDWRRVMQNLHQLHVELQHVSSALAVGLLRLVSWNFLLLCTYVCLHRRCLDQGCLRIVIYQTIKHLMAREEIDFVRIRHLLCCL